MAYEYSVRLHWNLTYNSFGGIMHCIEEVAAIKLDYSIIKMLAFGADYTEHYVFEVLSEGEKRLKLRNG